MSKIWPDPTYATWDGPELGVPGGGDEVTFHGGSYEEARRAQVAFTAKAEKWRDEIGRMFQAAPPGARRMSVATCTACPLPIGAPSMSEPVSIQSHGPGHVDAEELDQGGVRLIRLCISNGDPSDDMPVNLTLDETQDLIRGLLRLCMGKPQEPFGQGSQTAADMDEIVNKGGCKTCRVPPRERVNFACMGLRLNPDGQCSGWRAPDPAA